MNTPSNDSSYKRPINPLVWIIGVVLLLGFFSTNCSNHSNTSTYQQTQTSKTTISPSQVPQDKLREGKDKYSWPNGTSYDGDWKNNKMNGKGTILYPSGDKYTGDFVDNRKNGKGIYTWANNESYSGDWVNDKISGYGTYTFKNGDVYDGNWVDSKMSGQGTYKFKDGRELKGLWKDNGFVSK